MGLLATLRRVLMGLAGTLLAAAVIVAVARANEVSGVAEESPRGFVIHDATETLRDFCETDESGALWFALPGGSRWELVRSTSDPAILNPGDGAFHAYDVAEVRATLTEVGYPIERLSAEIFILPFPRRSALESAAGPGLILLSPGVQPLTPEHQHAELVHELGHVVQYALMPDVNGAEWQTYRKLRGITDESVYNAAAVHANRPHEIFAEDFRATFGDPLATYSGTIENASLSPPDAVPGLESFLLGLAGPGLALAAAPNPTRGWTQFSRAGVTTAPLDLFDLSGRRVASLAPSSISGGTLWIWSGRDASGRSIGAAVLFAKVRGERSAAVRFALMR